MNLWVCSVGLSLRKLRLSPSSLCDWPLTQTLDTRLRWASLGDNTSRVSSHIIAMHICVMRTPGCLCLVSSGLYSMWLSLLDFNLYPFAVTVTMSITAFWDLWVLQVNHWAWEWSWGLLKHKIYSWHTKYVSIFYIFHLFSFSSLFFTLFCLYGEILFISLYFLEHFKLTYLKLLSDF